MVQRRTEKEQKHVTGAENISLNGCTTTGDNNYDLKSSGKSDRDAARNSRCSGRFLQTILPLNTLNGRVTAEIRKRFQQLQNLQQKYAFLRPEVILSLDELNLDQAPQDINKEEFQLERVRLQAFVAATDPGCKKELIRSGSLG
ncbi:uncharacterized protein TNCV_1171541 [Trichonephila clavipes]|nr:uncharacterized protein TNCV_1171541 [Trichonephila clavipes]